MLLWRVCPAEASDRAFEGTTDAGRWNEAGTRLVYASESRALAAIEYAVHTVDGNPAEDLVAIAGRLGEDVEVEIVRVEDLPPGWDAPEGLPELRRLGTGWAASGRTPVLSVPSAVVPGDRNLLVNPGHPAASGLDVHAVEPFRLDPRLARCRPSRRSLPEVADGRERKLDPRVVGVRRIGSLLAVAVAAVVSLGGIGIGYAALTPSLDILAIVLSLWALGVAGLAVLAFVWPALAWRRAAYRLDGQGLEIRRGVWWRETLRVPRSRVQHTDVSQGPVERSFGLSTLVVHTAGTHHASIHLDGLDQPTAEAVRDFLIAGAEDAV